ncbi:MAG: CHAT domain-containing protein, partial [Magnetococcales bacterium]|nr:CHAT domain-containing protein [Magnetococcales bacterium]
MAVIIELRDTTLIFNAGEGRRGLDPNDFQRLRTWAESYAVAVDAKQSDALLVIGHELHAWLDAEGWLSTARQVGGTLEVTLQVAAAATADALTFLDVPWELLAVDGEFLAADSLVLFTLERRLGAPAGQPVSARHSDLAIAFMAAAPEGVEPELNYEAEEVAIYAATSNLQAHLVVEESGHLPWLVDRLHGWSQLPEVLHVSCHGEIDRRGMPGLMLEDPQGLGAWVSTTDFVNELGDWRPSLMFVSACRSAERAPTVFSLIAALTRSGVANVLGWDGSVYDQDATRFAEELYRQLARHVTPARAVALARRKLLRGWFEDPDSGGSHWHLARLLIGPGGGQPLCRQGLGPRPNRTQAGNREFLDKERPRIPVASREQFVGRRWELRTLLRAFAPNGRHWGALIHGMGRLGKSSLAARLANRLPEHAAVVVFKDYDRTAIFQAVYAKLPAVAADVRKDWLSEVQAEDEGLYNVLKRILHDQPPLLLIIDDLEQILEEPVPEQQGTRVRSEWRGALAAVLRAFRDTWGNRSRLLLTSRYPFTLPAPDGHDLAGDLLEVPLSPLSEAQRIKMAQAELRIAGSKLTDGEDKKILLARIQEVAQGNPGLQYLLTKPLLAGDVPTATQAVAEVAAWLAAGRQPEGKDVAEFFSKLTLDVYRRALTADQVTAFRAATLFELPAPEAAVRAAVSAAGVAVPEVAVARLVGLGLLDWHASAVESPHLLANRLARPLFPPALDRTEVAALARAALAPLVNTWADAEGDLPASPRGLEAHRLAEAADNDLGLLARAAYAAASWHFRRNHDANSALPLVLRAVEKLEAGQLAPSPHLLRLGAECARRLGDMATAERLLRAGLEATGSPSPPLAMLWSEWAGLLARRGKPDDSLEWLGKAEAVFRAAGDVRERAVTQGKIADILQARGQLDEALRIRV